MEGSCIIQSSDSREGLREILSGGGADDSSVQMYYIGGLDSSRYAAIEGLRILINT